MISVHKMSKKYGNHKILQEISVEFSGKNVYGLVGPNGSGKTTLMRCICGFAHPTSGEIWVEGKHVGHDVDFAPSTGVIIEAPGFLPYQTGLTNLIILANISGKADEKRARETMHIVGLNPDDKKAVCKYSLGMRQRLGIAQAIMEDPQNLILDEPFNGLDKQGVAEVHNLIEMLRSQGKTIILASHSEADIAKACDTTYFLENGELSKVTA